ncbi:MAG TPA: AsmA family protein [Porticoccus sp.]|nr:AsmA family protein [Porticoccus sp.]
MLRVLKLFFAVAFLLVIIVVGGVTYLLLGTDPNTYKPELEKLASQNDIALSIEGDLRWSFYPNLAVHAGATSLSGKEAGIPDIRFEQADFILDWKALLSRTIRLRAITIDGASIKVETTEEAASVVALPGAAAATQKSEATELPFEIAIDQLALTNSRIILVTPGAPDRILEQLNFTSKKLNLDGQPFPVTFKVSTTLPDHPNPISIALDTQLKLQLEEQQASLLGAKLTLNGFNELPLNLSFDALYDGQADSLTLNNVEGTLGSANIKGSIKGQQLTTAPLLTGELSLQNLVLAELPIEAPEGLNKVSIQSQFSASEKSIQLNDLKLALDNFNLNGKLSLKLENPRQLEMFLKGDNLTLPTSNKNSQEGNNAQAAMLSPILAPLALLEGGKGHIELNLASLTSDDIRIENLHLNLFANGKVVNIADLSGQVFGGSFQTTMKANLGKKSPSVTFTKQLVDIDLHQTLSTLAEQSDVRGTLTMDFSGTTQGDSQEVLMANVNGNGKFSVKNLQVDNINVERSYCEMAALIEKQPSTNQTWPNSTLLKDLQGDIQWRDQRILLPGFTTGLGNLAISGNGTVFLAEENYDMLITANLHGDKTSETGCLVKSKRIQNRDIPLRCRGSFAEDGGGNCLPDSKFISQLLQEQLQKMLFDKFLKKPESTENVSTDTAQEATPEEEKDIKQQVIEGLLKGIFK